MGGLPQAVKSLALAALACCAFGVSCADNDDGATADPHRAPRRVTARGSVGEAGAGGGAGSDAAGAPSLPADGGSGGRDGGSGLLPVDGGGGEPPSCGNQSGAVCGANMVPASNPAMRYFCSSGVLIAQARCPGVCLSKNNACGMGSGTGDGMDGAGLGALLHCRECLSVDCKAPLVACDADPWCAAHLDCKESCTVDEDCLSTCSEAFPEDPLMDELSECVLRTDCAAACAGN